ncbi:MAG: aconitase X catalytic domain-containing protein [Desulfurococcus sp.]|nr:aconitase X catalytic domain-containing protein [Desulfurococcus sp.]
MYLTRLQEAMLKGEYGWSTAKAVEILVKVGESMGAERLIEIVHAHVSGVSFSNIGVYGAEFIRELYEKGGRARVYTTVNPGGVDYSSLQSIIDNSLMTQQAVIDSALTGMGFKPVFTCIPYWYRPPAPGEHLAWGESSAVIVANSIYGGFTNREGGPVTLAAALTGFTYDAGLHKLENRVIEVSIEVSREASGYPSGAIGLWIGENIREKPLLTFARRLSLLELKVLLAAMAASGSHALAVIPGWTPQGTYSLDVRENITIEAGDLEKYIGGEYSLNGEILGYTGCPHLSLEEIMEVARILRRRGYRAPRRGKLLITIPAEYPSRFKWIVSELVSRGVEIAAGTCPVVSVLRRRYDVVVTNSGKAAFYLRRIHGLRVKIAGLREVVEAVYGELAG